MILGVDIGGTCVKMGLVDQSAYCTPGMSKRVL